MKARSFLIGPGLTCDVDALVNTRLLVQANSGAGKSWALRRLLEQTHGQIQQLVIDPEGEFASLREKFDYVLAARHGGDTLADPRSAKLLAERLLELGVSAILDIYELKAHERVRFVRVFLEALVDAPKSLWHPSLVILDEAHVYCPQHGEAESAGSVIDLCTRGRKRGYCAVLATQRLSKLHKDAAAECNNKLIGRSALDVDMKRASDELGFGAREQQQQLRELDAGEFYAFGPAVSRQVQRVKVGPVETTHPKAGSRLAGVMPPPTEKVKAVLSKLADLPAEAEAREKTIADLKRDVATLRRQLTDTHREARATASLAPKVERKEVAVLKDRQVQALKRLVARVEAGTVQLEQRMAATFKPITEALAATRAAAVDLGTAVRRAAAQAPTPTAAISGRPSSTRPLPAPTARPRRDCPPSAMQNGSGPLTGPEQRILDAIAWLESIGVSEPEQAAVAFLAGYTYGGGAFNNPKGGLRSKGLVEYVVGDRIRLTEPGRVVAQVPDAPLTTEELHERVLARLPGPEQRLLRPLLAAYPRPLANEDLAQAAGYTPNAGAFNNPRGRLRSIGLIDYPQPGMVRARPLLFLES